MAAATIGLTIDDFEKLSDEEAHYKELVNGELIDVSGNSPQHIYLREKLALEIGKWLERHNLGMLLPEQEYDFGGNAHGPDLTFFRTGKIPLINWKRRVQRFVPDLAIEIASPNDTYSSLMGKIRRYRACGVEEVWLFTHDPLQAEVFSAQRNVIYFENDVFNPATLEGLSIPLRQLFELPA
ncbi:MAG: Uma2 family endonuclease [Acidobacteriota bacterium]|nr:Uma2 family endonuclease [Acidobacteriota bacterium]